MNARKMFGRQLGKSRAQAMTEYIIIVSLVAVGCLAVVTAFGNRVANLFKRSTDALNKGKVTQNETVEAGAYEGLDKAAAAK